MIGMLGNDYGMMGMVGNNKELWGCLGIIRNVGDASE